MRAPARYRSPQLHPQHTTAGFSPAVGFMPPLAVPVGMSRVDFVVDGETVEQAHPHNMTEGDVRVSFDGGDTFPLEVARWEHVVIEVDTEPPE